MSSAASYGCVYFDRRCFRKDDVKSSKGRKLYVCNSVASTPQGLQFANTKVQIPEKTVRIGVLGASGYTGSEPDVPTSTPIRASQAGRTIPTSSKAVQAKKATFGVALYLQIASQTRKKVPPLSIRRIVLRTVQIFARPDTVWAVSKSDSVDNKFRIFVFAVWRSDVRLAAQKINQPDPTTIRR
ncbi:hypothetical protein HYC85_007598 [Camellia sinensis]|uniref:Uncharacterized protein n=1 Tax=Camellia sinensis TaxID=4442 RepID=A0A7J7HPD6_CAMSI|nr:hypothetical protein HYC85_007598 [Camellia sinensis]